MNVQRSIHDNSCDIGAQPTVNALHIPVSSTFIPYSQFSVSETATVRTPPDDNNNKAASMPVVSVVAAVSGMCPTISVVSMQQTAQLAHAVVAPTIIPTVVTPIAVQATSCLAPSTTMAVANTINIGNHLSLPQLQQQPLFSLKPQTSGLINTVINNTISSNQLQISTAPSVIKTTSNIPSNKTPTTSSPHSSASKLSNALTITTPVKPSTTNSKQTTPSSSSSQNAGSEQADDLVKPVFKDGELVLEVECGQNKAVLYLSKLCQGSKGPCISFQSSWLTPNEFQFVSGRETAKDWKRSIRHHGKSLKLLLAKGILNVHPTMCDCDGCRQGATLTRKGEKRRIPNGERKPRKSSTQLGGGGVDGGVVRAGGGGSSLMAAHFGTQGKQDIKRSNGDKVKAVEASTQSQHIDATNSHLKHGLTPKYQQPQRPDNLGQVRDINKPNNTASTSTSQVIAASTNVSLQSPHSTIPTIDSLATSVAAPDIATLHLIQPFAAFNLMSPCSGETINITQQTICKSSATAPEIQASLGTTPTQSATAISPELLAGHLQPTPDTAAMLSPNLPINNQAQIPTSSNEIECTKPTIQEDEDVGNCIYNHQEQADDDNHLGYEADESFNSDDRSDDENDDDQLDVSVKTQESKEKTSDHVLFSHSKEGNETETNNRNEKHENAITQNVDKLVDYVPNGNKELGSPKSDLCKANEAVNQLEEESGKDETLTLSEKSSSLSTPAVTTLAVSSLLSPSSNSMVLSVSTTNIRSEQIWVPPTMQPQDDTNNSSSRVIHGRSRERSPTDPTPNQDNEHTKEDHKLVPNNGGCKLSIAERIPSFNERVPKKSVEDITSFVAISPTKEVNGDRHMTSCPQENDGVFKNKRPSELMSHLPHPGQTIKVEKNTRDKEREERHRQKLREERSRREKEERARKDKEREARKEREKREEIEAERLRQEEKDRKAHAESKSSKDRQAAAAPSSDPYRRPPGGVIEAAAFSDYMRVLAANHSHPLVPHTPGYMSSVFPIRPQEPSSLFHPMAAFGPSLNNMHKDALMYPSTAGALPNFTPPSVAPFHSLLQRQPYTAQQNIMDYQRSLAAAAAATSYPWPSAYPYLFHEMASAATSASSATISSGSKRVATELESSVEINAKRFRQDGRLTDYSPHWDYFSSAASQQLPAPIMSAALPCGLESASADKTAEFLRKRYMEYWPQAAAYLSSLPEYSRSAYYCACADHRDDDIRMWSVDDVCKFLTTLEGCAVYVEHFREQRVNGRILCFLTPDHLVKAIGMKVTAAIVLSEAVAKKVQDISKMSNCEACRSIYLSQPMNPMMLQL